MRKRCNKYCFYSHEAQLVDEHSRKTVMGQMSDAAVRDVCHHIYGKALRQVPLFKSADKVFIKDIAMVLRQKTYGPSV